MIDEQMKFLRDGNMNDNLALMISGFLTCVVMMSVVYVAALLSEYNNMLGFIFAVTFVIVIIFFGFFRRVDEQKQ